MRLPNPTLRNLLTLAGVATIVAIGIYLYQKPYARPPEVDEGSPLAEIELKLKPLATSLGTPMPGEWLHRFPEKGQGFEDYRRDVAVRRSRERNKIYFCLVGDFTKAQEEILNITRDYVSIFFDVPVEVRKRMKADDLPAKAHRRHPGDGHHQLLSNYFINDLLKEDRPEDALAYVAFSSVDLWTREGDQDWNFVFGLADVRNRLGVWSMARFGDPATSPEARLRCIRLTLGTATHETGHVLTMYHCVYNRCCMNGSNSLEEALKSPLWLCPICLRKICWNLQVEPVSYLERLQAFCVKHKLEEEAAHYRRAIQLLEK